MNSLAHSIWYICELIAQVNSEHIDTSDPNEQTCVKF